MKLRLLYVLILLCHLAVAQKGKVLPDSVFLCAGDSNYLELKISLDNRAFISWETPFGIVANTRKVKAEKEGRYLVKISNNPPGTQQFDSSFVKLYSPPRTTLRDTAICTGQKLRLEAGSGSGYRYLWSNGESGRQTNIDRPGRYWVRISNRACSIVDTVVVKSLKAGDVGLPAESIFCLNDENKTLTVKVTPGTRILWNTGATSASIPVTREGTYWVKTEYKGCAAQTDTARVKFKVCECEMLIPNSFTPNEDNRNDYFFPVAMCEYSHYNITISDRWGNTVFSSNNINSKWDGRYKGNLCPEDIYVYRIESIEKQSEKKQVRNGHISLFR